MSREHCIMAQKMPEFLDMVSSSEFRVKKLPWAVLGLKKI